jgi:hypothetical protein
VVAGQHCLPVGGHGDGLAFGDIEQLPPRRQSVVQVFEGEDGLAGFRRPLDASFAELGQQRLASVR